MSSHPTHAPESSAVFTAAFARMDDAALLAHFRSSRSVHFYPVADPQETEPRRIAAILDGDFEFNRETYHLGANLDWLRNPSADLEWHILLHKFYYAVGLGLAYHRDPDPRWVHRWCELIDSWIDQTPPGFIAADVTGRRVQNWIYSYHHFVTSPPVGDVPIAPAWHRRLLKSIHEQVSFLRHNLTAKRNHRTLELYAIFLAAVVFPEFAEADEWRGFALEQIVRNMDDDLLPDGVQCELSTDYHHLVLKNYLNVRRLASLNGIAVPSRMDAHLNRALDFSLHVHKPDGLVPSLSDGDVHDYRELLAIGASLFGRDDLRYVASAGAEGTPPAQRVAHFPDAGYTIVREHWGTAGQAFRDARYLVFDTGPLGEGNHGHFDCLSLELAAFGRSLVVDPGRFTYSEAGPINWRVAFRHTAAHNTVCIDGLTQTRYRPKPVKEASRHAPGSVRHKISGPAPAVRLRERCHLPGVDLLHGQAASHEYPIIHDRCVVVVDQAYWLVSDWLHQPVAGDEREHAFTLSWQLGESAQGATRLAPGGGLRLHSPGLLIAQPERPGQRHEVLASWVSSAYGDKRAEPAVRSHDWGRHARFDSVLWPWAATEPALFVDDLPVGSLDDRWPECPDALRIRLETRDDGFIDTWWHARQWAGQACVVDGIRFVGRWLLSRRDSAGRLRWLRTHAGARAEPIGDRAVAEILAREPM